MKSIFKAATILGSSSVITVLVGLAASKLWAILIGPAGLGYLAMSQNLLGLAALLTGVGVNTGIVRMGAKAIAEEDKIGLAANQKAAIIISIGGGLIGFLLLFLFSSSVNRVMLDGRASASEVTWLGVALLFTLLTNTLIGILNAHHNVKALAKVSVINTVLNTGILLGCVWVWNVQGIFVGIIAGAISICLTSYYFAKRETDVIFADVPASKLKEKVLSLLRFGMPYTASTLVGTGVQLLLPVLILHQLDLESVGYYRAAATISVTSLGLVLTAIAQDYYPRVSAISDDSRELVSIINQQLFLSVVLMSPMLLWLLFLSPFVVPLLFSAKFAFTAEVLNWMLVGDIFKVLAWTLSFVILARSKGSLFFFIECFGGAMSLLTSLIGMRLFGVKGLGLSYLATLVLFYLLVFVIMRRQIGLKYTRQNKILVLLTLVSAVGISGLNSLGYETLKTVFALVVCLASTAISSFIVIKYYFYETPEPEGGE